MFVPYCLKVSQIVGYTGGLSPLCVIYPQINSPPLHSAAVPATYKYIPFKFGHVSLCIVSWLRVKFFPNISSGMLKLVGTAAPNVSCDVVFVGIS